MKNILYTCIRGSHLYGLNTENSDLDTASIYIADSDELYGLPQFYIPYKSDEKQDNTIFEIGRVIELLVNSNPTMLELIFANDEHIVYKHPVIQLLLDNKEKFLSKQVIKSLSGYARSQIYKARGLNKKIVNPVTERKTPIDFCFTFNDKQGTEPITQWLEKNGLKQKYCGLNHLPNMNQMYGVFYDWQQHLKTEYSSGYEFAKKFSIGIDYSPVLSKFFPFTQNNKDYIEWDSIQDDVNYLEWIWNNAIPKGYHGIQKEDGSSNQIHLDSILKGDKPICYLSYNENGYQTHCRQYKEYKEWELKRNPIRYESNLNKNYDAKNMCHCIRLLTMACELAENNQFCLDRTNIDRSFLLEIKNHQYEYDEIMKFTDDLMNRLQNAISSCTLPEDIDVQWANNLLIQIRKDYYGR